jgi:hypothetical protein
MPILNNPRHERFANLIVDGNSASAAHKEAGFSGDRRDASRMRQRKDVTRRIQELTAAREVKLAKATARAVERHAVTIEGLLDEAADIQSRATEAGNYAAAISALTAKAKLAGLWVERTDNKNRTVARGVAGLTDEELLEIALGGPEAADEYFRERAASAADPEDAGREKVEGE